MSQVRRVTSVRVSWGWIPACLAVLAVCGCFEPFSTLDPHTPPLAGKASPTIHYKAHPRLFVTGLRVGALAALPDRLLATTVGEGPDKLVEISRDGHVLRLGIDLAARPEETCMLALSPGQHPGFREGEPLVSTGTEIWRVQLEARTATHLASIPAADGEVTGLCFDTVGDFAFAPLVLASGGNIYRLDSGGALLRIGDVGAGGRDPSVAAQGFGPHAGQLLVAFPACGDVRAISATGHVSRVTGWSGVSGAHAFPETPIPFGDTGAALFVAVRTGETGRIYQFTTRDVANAPGGILLTSLHSSGSGLMTLPGGAPSLAAWGHFMGPEVAATLVARPAIARVAIDVQPGAPDDILWQSALPISVAVLSSPLLAPSLIDAGSVSFAGALAVISRKGTLATYNDLNGDGTLDLVLSFRPEAMDVIPGPAVLILEGTTFSGERVRGEAHVRVVEP